MTKRNIHWAFVLLAYFTLLSQSIIDNARGPAYPDILTDFSINASRGSWLFAWASLAGLVANATARWWLPKVEAVIATIASLLLMSLGSLLFSYSKEIGVFALDLSSIIMGLGMGGANVAMNLLIARGTPLSHRRQFYAGLHSVYGLGSLSAPLLLSFYISSGGEWSSFFIWLSLLPFIILSLSLLKYSELAHESIDFSKPRARLAAPIKLSSRLAYGCVFAFYVASEIVISTRLVIYLTSSHNINITDARMALSFFFLALLAGRLLFTVVPLKGASQRWMLLSCLLTLCIYLLARLFSPLLLSLCGASMSFFYPVAMDWLSKKFPTGLEWMTASVLTNISLILVIMHISFGYISDILGLEFAMGLIPVFQLLCLGLVVTLGKAD